MLLNLKVRDYVAGDFDKVNRVWIETGMGGSVRGDDAKIIDRTLKSGGKLLVLENTDTNEIIGTSWLTHDERRIYMHHFGIKPAYQGNGFAHKLMKASMDFAQSGIKFLPHWLTAPRRLGLWHLWRPLSRLSILPSGHPSPQ